MTSIYKDGFVKNVFQQLDTESSLCVLGLCLASNDIVLNYEQINDNRHDENTFFFATTLSTLREVAKIVMKIDQFMLKTHFSQDTRNLLEDLKEDLLPFQDDSLTKGTLKPVRDHIFHYDFTESDQQERLASLLDVIKNESELRVRISSDNNTILRHRYTFADIFRNELMNSWLSKEIVDQISIVAINIVAFTDSLLTDLLQ